MHTRSVWSCCLYCSTASCLTPTFGLPALSIILTDLLGSRDREEACVCVRTCMSLLKNMWFYLQKSDFIPGFLTHTRTPTCTCTPGLWCKIRGSSGASQVPWEEEVERGEMKRKKKERWSLLKQGCCFNNPRALHLLWPSISLSFSTSLSVSFFICWSSTVGVGWSQQVVEAVQEVLWLLFQLNIFWLSNRCWQSPQKTHPHTLSQCYCKWLLSDL